MFDFLKKKISGFVSGLSKKEDEKPLSKEAVPEPVVEGKTSELIETIQQTQLVEESIKQVESVQTKVEKQIEKPILETKKPEEKAPALERPIVAEKKIETPKPKPPEQNVIVQPTPQTTRKPEVAKSEITAPKQAPIQKTSELIEKPIEVPKKHIEVQKPKFESEVQRPKEKEQKEQELLRPKEIEKSKSEEKEKDRLKLGIVSSVKTLILGETQIKESDIKDMLDNLELELLEADVEMSVSQFIVESLRSKLIGVKVKRGSVSESINQAIKETLIEVLENEKSFDFLEKIKSLPKPVKIVFVGINGAGKTTTIAKVVHLLQQHNLKVVVAAGDTFRAAAIEQLSVHTDRLGVRLIKRDYGSDPTSVAFDAVSYAKAHSIDVVLIDTAGRQDTNISLINEMKKMVRVISPDLKVYIGESVSGNAIIEQVSSFNREISLDGIILTKLDCDPKGGTVLSINKTSGVPIVLLGIGQKYEDLEVFDSAKIVSRILS